MKDFDKLFEAFLRNKIEENGDLTPDEIEDRIPEFYEEWATTPNPETNGFSPEGYFASVSDPKNSSICLSRQIRATVIRARFFAIG